MRIALVEPFDPVTCEGLSDTGGRVRLRRKAKRHACVLRLFEARPLVESSLPPAIRDLSFRIAFERQRACLPRPAAARRPASESPGCV